MSTAASGHPGFYQTFLRTQVLREQWLSQERAACPRLVPTRERWKDSGKNAVCGLDVPPWQKQDSDPGPPDTQLEHLS